MPPILKLRYNVTLIPTIACSEELRKFPADYPENRFSFCPIVNQCFRIYANQYLFQFQISTSTNIYP